MQRSFKTRAKELADAKSTADGHVFEHDNTRYSEGVTIAGSSTGTIKTTLPLPPQPLLLKLPLPPPPPLPAVSPNSNPSLEVPESTDPPSKKKTQSSKTLQQFQDAFPQLLGLIFEQEADARVGEACACGAQRTTRCLDCLCYEISCTDCFIHAHRNSPTHWAEVWNFEQGFFIRHDIGMLRDDIASVNLGHYGRPCHSAHATINLFEVIDTNGIHKTKIRFCTCQGSVDRAEQLMRAQLFPATMTQPTMAFTFRVLRQYHLHHLEGKESAHDFIGALRRLTDNMFPQRVSDPSSQFRLVMRIWRFLTATKRQGQAHGIDSIIRHRREGNLVVHCPCCLEPHVNMEPGWERTPPTLRHLNQTQYTADGNHHSNKYSKNTDPDDVSLCDGKAYFPNEVEYREYIRNLPNTAPEKTPCDHLNALNKQNRKKFRNMDITGIVNIQCSHIFIKSTVDLQLGEKFANTDYALSHAIRHMKRVGMTPSNDDLKFITDCDHLFSYDISCGFCINAVKRFRENFPDEADFIDNIRWLIPLVHVQNHKDNCTYQYSSAYIEGACHFQGETAEMPWVELNQLAPQTRQMNNGHRQDTIIDHHSYWNWMKTSNIVSQLRSDLIRSKRLFVQKHLAFKTLCAVYADSVPEWNSLDRQERRFRGRSKEVQCVYRQDDSKVPSRTRIFDAMLAEEAESTTLKERLRVTAPCYLNEGILIQEEQREVIQKARSYKKDLADLSKEESSDRATEIEKRRERLRKRIDDWRDVIQTDLVPQIGDVVAQQAISGKSADKPETEILYLPSDFTEADRIKFNLVQLGEHERHLLQGTLCDFVAKIKTQSKTIDAFKADKKAQAYGQRGHTRATKQVHDVEERRNGLLAHYSASRQAMISLGMSPDDLSFPNLTLEDTYRKATHSKRAVGDSTAFDGLLWTRSGVTGGARALNSTASGSVTAMIGTQVVHPKRHHSPSAEPKAKGKKRRIGGAPPKHDGQDEEKLTDGWIWSFRPQSGMSDEEVEKWMKEGDRVQWFRAEAEMERWREEWEAKQADFLRCIRTFGTMSAAWKTMASSSGPGRTAYAKQRSAMYCEMERDAKDTFSKAGYGDLVRQLIDDPNGKILADFVTAERSDPMYIIPELNFEDTSEL